MGLTRVILSRELSLEEIEEIRQQVPDMEIEIFVHGALCMAYSCQPQAPYCPAHEQSQSPGAPDLPPARDRSRRRYHPDGCHPRWS
ncbi:U32 family peptidase, partial [Salmonella enterica subsp. enterica serovar Anatum]|nr:U32 family peptidase [Salmonella enterica subsp. enterica serovar Anatum]